MKKLSIWHLTREYAGLAEAGGLKDVPRGLAEAALARGHDVKVFLPYYGFMAKLPLKLKKTDSFSVTAYQSTYPVTVYKIQQNKVPVYLLECSCYQGKESPYSSSAKTTNPPVCELFNDINLMNIVLQKSVIEFAKKVNPPDVFHLHDGHTAFLAPLIRHEPYAEYFKKSAVLLTIHNAGEGYHQTINTIQEAVYFTGLPEEVLSKGLLNNKVDPLALAAFYCHLATVSPEYAYELTSTLLSNQTDGLSTFYDKNNIYIYGAYNGVSVSRWDPRHKRTSGLPYCFHPGLGFLGGKVKCRNLFYEKLDHLPEHLLKYGGLEKMASKPLFAFHSRLVDQKGVSYLTDAIDYLLTKGLDAQFVIIGQGQKNWEESLRKLSEKYQDSHKLVYIEGYDDFMVRLTIAASDFFLLPSLFEPCGLTDLYAQLLGTVPIAHATGGLGKIKNGVTGMLFKPLSVHNLSTAIEQAVRLKNDKPHTIKKLQKKAFNSVIRDFRWSTIFRRYYEQFYYKIVREAKSC